MLNGAKIMQELNCLSNLQSDMCTTYETRCMAQHEPARHSVVLDCKLLPLHNMPKFACCLLYNAHAIRLTVSQNAKI